jgi:hypothetical protein
MRATPVMFSQNKLRLCKCRCMRILPENACFMQLYYLFMAILGLGMLILFNLFLILGSSYVVNGGNTYYNMSTACLIALTKLSNTSSTQEDIGNCYTHRDAGYLLLWSVAMTVSEIFIFLILSCLFRPVWYYYNQCQMEPETEYEILARKMETIPDDRLELSS